MTRANKDRMMTYWTAALLGPDMVGALGDLG